MATTISQADSSIMSELANRQDHLMLPAGKAGIPPRRAKRFYVTTALMGYGHIRAAANLTGYGDARLTRVDQPPFAHTADMWMWRLSQHFYHGVSRKAECHGHLLFHTLLKMEEISDRRQGVSLTYSRLIHILASLGAGAALGQTRHFGGAPLLHTFFVPALYAIYHHYPGRNCLLLCDADFHRAWVPLNPKTELTYFVPTTEGADRLMSYGVSADKILLTGFPLPPTLLGGREMPVVRADFEARRKRLHPQAADPLTVTFSFSGAGAYLQLLGVILRGAKPQLESGELRFIIAVGDNFHARRAVEEQMRHLGLESDHAITIIGAGDILKALDFFNQALRETDLLITKPSELSFYTGLGLPEALLPPIGPHEDKNRFYLMRNEAALDLPDAANFAEWVEARRRDGSWLRVAESAFANIPKDGVYRIHEQM